jgi:hypothetical protein
MNLNYQMEAKAQCEGAISRGPVDRPSPTLAENIDYRIASLQNQVERLQKVKQLLASPAGLLSVPIEDLRFAMNY